MTNIVTSAAIHAVIEAIVQIKNTRELPNEPVWGHSLGKGYTEENAVLDYMKHYGCLPPKGYRFGTTFLYFAEPL